MILAVAESTWILLGFAGVITLLVFLFSSQLTPKIKPMAPKPHLPMWITIKVQGGPDHGHSQQEPMPQNLESFFGFLRSMTKFKMLESSVIFKLEPEPMVLVTRQAEHLERFKPERKEPTPFSPPPRLDLTGRHADKRDPRPHRHDSLKELGE
jgi:hypothetical protein